MSSSKIVAVLLLIGAVAMDCSVLAPAPALRYAQFAPQNIAPFAAQVSTFTKGLNIYAAPYAAGVLSAPAIAPALPPAYAPAPYLPASPYLPAPAPAYYAGAPGPLAAAPAPYLPAPLAAPAPYLPAPLAAAPAPYLPSAFAASPLLPAPFARSVHAVGPGYAPALAPAPLLG